MKSQMHRGNATRATDFYKYFTLIIFIALAVAVRQPAYAQSHDEHGAGGHKAEAAHGEAPHGEAAESGEAKGHGEHACPQGAICLHPHGHDIPELANAVDFYRAMKKADVLLEGDSGTLETAPDGSLILTDEKMDFKKRKVGGKIYLGEPLKSLSSPLGDRVEDMLYTVWIDEGPYKGRYAVTQVEQHRLLLQASHEAAAGGHHEKQEGPVTVSYRVKEEATMTSRLIGAGFMGLNWNDIANIVFAFLTVIFLVIFSLFATRNLKKIPTGFQAFVELFVGWLDFMTRGLIGPDSRKYLPLLGTCFMYVLSMALMGLIPGAKSPIAVNLNIPLSVAICVFLFVQYHGIKQNGIKKYVKHFTGDKVGIIILDQFLMILNTFLHVLGEFIKPISLSLRLYANITAEDILIAVLVGLSTFIFPLQVLFFPLGLMFSFIQALVFMSLSAIYISQMSAHHEHHGEEGHHH